MHTYIHAYIHTYMHACIHTCTYINIVKLNSLGAKKIR